MAAESVMLMHHPGASASSSVAASSSGLAALPVAAIHNFLGGTAGHPVLRLRGSSSAPGNQQYALSVRGQQTVAAACAIGRGAASPMVSVLTSQIIV